ncbi:MAG: FadR family transcriptional regulator [Clostridioides sp.]|nr:FadR family transcriptional regulator [Clostridioides sp.]
MALKRIEKINISEQVFEILKNDILEGNLVPGEKLPSEVKLSDDLGVSKSSVRVAIQRLATLGIVETKAGLGSYVKEFDANNYLDQMQEFLLSDKDMKQVTEYRLITEMSITKLAIKRATEDDYAKLEDIVVMMNDSLMRGDAIAHGKLDFRFHLEICKSTQNEVFSIVYELMRHVMKQHTTNLNEIYMKKVVSDDYKDDVHWRLVQAMRARNIEKCQKCYEEMLLLKETQD